MNKLSTKRFIPWLAWLVLLVTLGAAFWAYDAAVDRSYQRDQARFLTRVGRIQTAVRERMNIYEQFLHGIRGLYAASRSVERSEWQAYLSSVKIEKNYPGTRGVAYVSYVPGEQVDAFVAAVRADGFPQSAVRPEGRRPEYFVVTYLEPPAGSPDFFGYDIAMDTVIRRAAAERARDRGIPTLTGLVTLVGDTEGRSGFAYILPVYRNSLSTETPEERRAALQGWIYCPFEPRELLRGILGDEPADVDFEIFDGIEIDRDHLVFSTHADLPYGRRADARFTQTTPIEVGDRLWLINVISRPEFDASSDRARPILVLLVGLLGSFLVFSVTWSLATTRRRAIAEAESMTAELRETQKDLLTARYAAEGANRAKGDFLAHMSHELRAPLNSIIGFAQILQSDRSRKFRDTDLAYVDRILENANHLLTLINEVLDMSKVEARQMAIDLEDVDLEVFVRHAIEQMEGRVLGRPVKLVADLPRPIAPLETDPIKFKQVLFNLIGNALKFTESGTVTVRVVVDPESRIAQRIDVEDTGIGIPADKLQTIFEPFRQGAPDAARKFGGTGLGLTISRSLCQLMGYRLEAESRVGHGSTFRIVIPEDARRLASAVARRTPLADYAPDDETRGTRDEPAGFAGRSVLIIDDEPDSRLILARHFDDLGFRIHSAGSADQGLRMARELRPDVITVDLLMRQKNGWDVIRNIRNDPLLLRVPILVVSNIAADHRASLPGAAEILNKPVSPADLEAALRKHLAAPP